MPTDNIDTGLAADRPNPSHYNKDKFWYSTDTEEMFLSDGTQWIGPLGADAAEPPKVVSNVGEIQYPLTNAVDIDTDGGQTAGLAAPMDVQIVNTNPVQAMRVVAHAHLPPLNLSPRNGGSAPIPGRLHYSRTAVLEHVEGGSDYTEGSTDVGDSEVAPLGSGFGSPIVVPGLHLQMHIANLPPNTLATFRLSEWPITLNFDDATIDHIRVGVQENNSTARARVAVTGIVI